MNKSVPELVESFVRGDNTAFAELVRRYRQKIYTLAYRVLGNHLDADEVVQETFVRVYRRRRELGSVKYFSTFLIRIATNYSIDLLRKRRSQSIVTDDTALLPGEIQLDLASRVVTPDEEYENKCLMAEITEALEHLPPKQKLTAILHDIQGFSKSEIAQVFGCPEATVRSNLHIARSKLKRIIKQRWKERE
jgi:RNA polymerase sigma-70 factor (ECF subfamily)